MARARRWTDQQLIDAVATSATLAEVMVKLGVRPGKYDVLRAHIDRLQIDANHLASVRNPRTRRPRRWTDDDLAAALESNVTISGVLRSLGYQPSGGMHRFIVSHIRELGLDTSHLLGQSWAKGQKVATSKPRPLAEILVRGSTYRNSSRLRARLIRAGLKQYRCEHCGCDEWMGQALPLAIHHVNGDHTDNRLTNLRILCPNCHALTSSWCRRRTGQPA